MAGDWIKFDVTTPDKPEVVKMAAVLGIDQDAVVGKLLRVWAWADQNTITCNGESNGVTVTSAFLDRLTFCPGFASALRLVGWLVGDDGALSFPNFERHNGKTSKERAVSNRRVAKHRTGNGKGNGDSVTDVTPAPLQKPLPEKRERREERKQEQKHESPDGDSESQSDLLDGKVAQHPTDRVCQLVLDCYHAALPNCARIEVLNPKRQRRILAANKLAAKVCKQQGWNLTAREFWDAYFDECAADPWMRGEVPNPNNPRWKQNLFVLIEEDRFASVMDKAIEAMRRERAQVAG